MKKVLDIALVGIGGYGELYVKKLLQGMPNCKFVGAVDPFPERAKSFLELKAHGIPVHHDLESLYAHCHPALIALASPIPLHREQAEFALAQGSNVLCEKPAAGSLADALALQEAERKAQGLFLAIGYQWSFSRTFRALKDDVAAGVFGRPLRLRTLTLWPRAASYYKRNSWAGAVKTPEGVLVNDSPLNNACAHYLHNSLHLLSVTEPSAAQADVIRANRMQNYDTVAFRCQASGAEILFYSSHATSLEFGPLCLYEFEKATISYDCKNGTFVAKFKDGARKNYGNPGNDVMEKLDCCVKAIEEGTSPACRIGDALAQTRCMALAAQTPVKQVPSSELELLENSGDPLTTIKALPESMVQAFAKATLLSEAGDLAWLR